MGLAEKVGGDITAIFNTTWNTRKGVVVPTTDTVALRDGAVKLEAVLLYADLANSTKLARAFPRSVAAKIVRAYLSSMTQVVKAHGGHVRSFDGDRVMAVFVGPRKQTNAAKCALRMNYVVSKQIRPKARAKFPSLASKGFSIRHCVGVARSEVFVVRGGVRGSNDLVFVGSAPNIAAKLSDIRAWPYASYMTGAVYHLVQDQAKFADDEPMWEKVSRTIDGATWTLYRSKWTWKP